MNLEVFVVVVVHVQAQVQVEFQNLGNLKSHQFECVVVQEK